MIAQSAHGPDGLFCMNGGCLEPPASFSLSWLAWALQDDEHYAPQLHTDPCSSFRPSPPFSLSLF